ncbi:MAG: methyltransferase domain-containing protein [Candidatus Bathyarchaeota archaeon]|nr:methyltransferase domain-containing protein [Candidatus Bathyarchaeum tardum]WGM88561.1 MAG: methyltransferase domain-containing protein [Candidatus Bathyarchaeum tardum]WNZ29172.1 MAG: methyltransferase domain-containing protein [Candidatus Bathyarchaeota archaeon]
MSPKPDTSHHLFDPKNIHRLESKERKATQDPEIIIKLLDLKSNDIVADLGAGTGYFSIPISSRVKLVYAIDIQQEMLDYLKQKIDPNKNSNIRLILSNDANQVPLQSESVDFLLTVNTLHEFQDKDTMITEIKRVLKPKGKTGIIDFKKVDTISGPPLSVRVSQLDAIKMFENNGFTSLSVHDLASNYLLLFQK